jgi:hypothetical protein
MAASLNAQFELRTDFSASRVHAFGVAAFAGYFTE